MGKREQYSRSRASGFLAIPSPSMTNSRTSQFVAFADLSLRFTRDTFLTPRTILSWFGHARLILGAFVLQGSIAEASSASVAEVRSTKRRRKRDHVEIFEDHVFITDHLLEKGGFGEITLADYDYNGHNAAAQVCCESLLGMMATLAQ